MSLFENYEQQFATTTTDATICIGRVRELSGGEKNTVISQAESCLQDAKDLVDQMELTLLENSPETRKELQKRVNTYKSEIDRLNRELEKAQTIEETPKQLQNAAKNITTTSEDHRDMLRDNETLLDKSTQKLHEGQKIVIQTEDIGLEIMGELREQRETIEHSRDSMRNVEADLSNSSRIISRMKIRIYQNKFILIIGAIVMVVILILLIFIIAKVNIDKKNS